MLRSLKRGAGSADPARVSFTSAAPYTDRLQKLLQDCRIVIFTREGDRISNEWAIALTGLLKDHCRSIETRQHASSVHVDAADIDMAIITSFDQDPREAEGLVDALRKAKPFLAIVILTENPDAKWTGDVPLLDKASMAVGKQGLAEASDAQNAASLFGGALDTLVAV